LIRLWDATSYQLLHVLVDHKDLVRLVAYSPDGKILASGSDDGIIRTWESRSGRELRIMKGGERRERTRRLEFSPDGKRLILAHQDGLARVWDEESGKMITSPAGHDNDWIESVSFNPDGSRIVTSARDKTIRLWDPNTGDQLLVLRQKNSDPLGARFTPDGSDILSWGFREPEFGRIWVTR
jgi:WD40 repeat protein